MTTRSAGRPVRSEARTDGVVGNDRQRLAPYRKSAAMIERHWDGIASYCRPENKVSLGLVEGLNNKIRVPQHRAYGYRDEDYLKLKIVAAFLPPLTRSAEQDPL